MNKQTTSSRFLYHAPCPSCGSSDAFGVYERIGTKVVYGYCFSCETYQTDVDPENNMVENKPMVPTTSYTPSPPNYPDAPLKERGIRADVVQTFGVRVHPNTGDHYYPYYKG